MRITRRDFARRSAGLLGTAALRAAVTRPDLILYNANIHTMDPANPAGRGRWPSPVDRFLAVGTKTKSTISPPPPRANRPRRPHGPAGIHRRPLAHRLFGDRAT